MKLIQMFFEGFLEEQLKLNPSYIAFDRLTVAEILGIILEHHLAGKACARPFASNIKAWRRTSGGIFFDALTEPDISRHLNIRKGEGKSAQTLRHDLKMITMAFGVSKRYKRNRYTVAGFDFTPLRLPEEDPTKYILRPKCKPRKRPVQQFDFAKIIEHAHPNLAQRLFFAIDTGMNPKVLESLTPDVYNPYTDCLDIQRGKTGEVGSLPVSDRCRAIILDAIKEKRKLVLDWTNHDKQVKAVRKASGVYFQFGRDLRTTYGNKIYAATKSDQAAQRAMLHRDPRTWINHYKIDHAEDLRAAIKLIETDYRKN